MITRVNEIFIGKDIARTVALADAADIVTVQENIVEGEVVVLDKNFAVAAVDVEYSDSNIIYIAEGSSETFSYVNEAGSSFSGRKLLVSRPIDGARIKTYSGAAYVAKTEQVTTIPAITDTIVAGTEYVLRVVYKDIIEHPAQFTQTYRYTAKTGDTSQDVFNGLRARIAKHTGKLSINGGSRIVGSGTTTLILTAKAIPECTTAVTDIDELTQVIFEVNFNYVDSDYRQSQVGLASAITTVAANRGKGSWEVIRDVEKKAQSYRGIDNRVWFPIQTPAFRTVKGAQYTTIVIEHDTLYRSSDNQYAKETPNTVQIAINGVNANQGFNIQTRLNSWMGSVPGGFAALAVFTNV